MFNQKYEWGEYFFNFESGNPIKGVKNPNGEIIIPCLYGQINYSETLFPKRPGFILKKDNLFGYAQIDGTIKIEPCYQDFKILSSELATFKLNNKYGILRSDFSILIEPWFDQVFLKPSGKVHAIESGQDYFMPIEEVLDGSFQKQINTLKDQMGFTI